MGPSRIQDGSTKDPRWFQDGSKMDPPMIHEGSKKEPIWLQEGPNMGPFGVQDGSTTEPRWFQDGSKLDPSMIQVGSKKEPIWFQDEPREPIKSPNMDPSMIQDGSENEPIWFQYGPRMSPSSFPTRSHEGNFMVNCVTNASGFERFNLNCAGESRIELSPSSSRKNCKKTCKVIRRHLLGMILGLQQSNTAKCSVKWALLFR